VRQINVKEAGDVFTNTHTIENCAYLPIAADVNHNSPTDAGKAVTFTRAT
jgi:hypothetical protein